MKLIITSADNGFIVTEHHIDDRPIITIYESKLDKLEFLRDMLYHIAGSLGYYGSKYDKERIHIELRPGANYEPPMDQLKNPEDKSGAI